MINTNEILVCITKDNNKNALKLKAQLNDYFDVLLIEADDPFNESVKQTKLKEKKYLYYINSNVFIENAYTIWRCINDIGKYENNDDVYVWAPSSKGYFENKNTAFIRDVAYVSDFTFLCKMEVLEAFYPYYGGNLDKKIGYFCKKLGGRCVIDDRVEVLYKG